MGPSMSIWSLRWLVDIIYHLKAIFSKLSWINVLVPIIAKFRLIALPAIKRRLTVVSRQSCSFHIVLLFVWGRAGLLLLGVLIIIWTRRRYDWLIHRHRGLCSDRAVIFTASLWLRWSLLLLLLLCWLLLLFELQVPLSSLNSLLIYLFDEFRECYARCI